jgi:hypothetical protein
VGDDEHANWSVTAIREGVGVARTKARVLASIRALPTLPRANHAAKTFLSLLTNMTVFRIGQFTALAGA